MLKRELKCFFIDDLKEEHVLFTQALEQTGLSVQCFHYMSGADALNQLRGSIYPIPDVIFVDVNMTGVSGLGFLEEVKTIERLSHLPVYMYSVEDYPSTISQAIKLGATGYLIKKSDVSLQAEELKAVFTEGPRQQVG